MEQIDEVAARILPDTISASPQGAAQVFQTSIQNLWVLLIMAILVVYIILAFSTKASCTPSPSSPVCPQGGLGHSSPFYLFKVELNLYSFVGLIMLIGIVKKNAIMRIDFALAPEREEYKSPLEAIYRGCLIRFRPITMTTTAVLLGALPIAVSYGAGGEVRQPLGLAVVGGLLVSQFVTIYLTPVHYTYIANAQQWYRTRRQKKVSTELKPSLSLP